MNSPHAPLADPIAALIAAGDDGVLAVITDTEGPSYRPVGATMALLPDGSRIGTLSSGCIEADLGLHAQSCLKTGTPMSLRYGQRSPFKDITLPCGGGLDILLIPRPGLEALTGVAKSRAARQPAALFLGPDTGTLALAPHGPSGWLDGRFRVAVTPEIAFFVFGKGPESSTFAAMAHSAGYDVILCSPDDETRHFARAAGCATHRLTQKSFPETLAPDAYSAVVLFFHDHDWEPPILLHALRTPAFYVGAQGSQRARDLRCMEMTALGASEAELARLRGPIGLIPSVRDARTLAVSVLAEILDVAKPLLR